jgi:alpha-tubulin suppressor-like RCC1 family protein
MVRKGRRRLVVLVVLLVLGVAVPVLSASWAGAAVLEVAAGGWHTCARISDGTARCWGDNSYGQLGDGTRTDRKHPVTVKNGAGTGPLDHITAISAGLGHTCARISDGTARCWGLNISGELADGTLTDRKLPVKVKNVAGTGPLDHITAISTGDFHTCARISDGTARCWGNNAHWQLGDGIDTDRKLPVKVKNVAGTDPLDHITAISTGGNHTCARISDGTARCWGGNFDGQLGDGTTFEPDGALPVKVKNVAGTGPLDHITAISTGDRHTCARISDGTARCWGGNFNGQLGDRTRTDRKLPVIVKNANGTARLARITAISTGGNHTCARISDGTARCWGDNSSGELGDGTRTSRKLPVSVKNANGTARLARITAISTGGNHTCARISDGTARCWGNNRDGELGDGTDTDRNLPVKVG